MPRIAIVLVAILLGGAWAAPAQVKLGLASGTSLVGELQALDLAAGARLLLKGGGTADVPLADLVEIAFPGAAVMRQGADSPFLRFDLVGGDLLYGEVIDGDFDQVRLETEAGRIDLPLDRLKSLRVLANAGGVAGDLETEGPKDRDVLFVRSGEGLDQVVGEVARFAKTGVWFDWTGEEESLFSFRKDAVVALRLAAPLPLDPIAGSHARVHFRDGSRLTGVVTKKEGGPLVLEHPFGFRLDLDSARVAAITFHGGRFVHLSDLEPSSFVETPYIQGGLLYGHRRDESLKGGPLTIGGQWFPKGISCHTRSVLTWDLDGEAASFSCSVGVDGRVADARVKGSIAFSIAVDDRVVFGPVTLAAGEEPRSVDAIDLRGARRLVLKADWADNHHFNGWAVWGSPILTRDGESR